MRCVMKRGGEGEVLTWSLRAARECTASRSESNAAMPAGSGETAGAVTCASVPSMCRTISSFSFGEGGMGERQKT